MPQFSPGQLALLNDLFAHAGENLVPGTWLTDGTVSFAKTVLGDFATGAQGVKADTAYGWGNHASAGYATGTQGSKADTAYGWGNHALAGYLTTHRALKEEKGTPSGGQLTLTGSPASGSSFLVFQAGLLIDSATYTYNAGTKTFSSLANVATTVLYLE